MFNRNFPISRQHNQRRLMMNTTLKGTLVAAPFLLLPVSGAMANSALSHSGNFCSIAPVENALAGGENGISGFGGQAAGINAYAGAWFSDFTGSGPTSPIQNSQGFFYSASETISGAGGAARPGVANANLYAWNGSGLPGGYSISFSGDLQDTHDSRQEPTLTRHGELMGGFLHSIPGTGATITLSSTGIAPLLAASNGTTYSVTLYIDGENPPTGTEITTWTAALTAGGAPITYFGLDDTEFVVSPSTETIGDFVQVTSTVAGAYQSGNYVTFTGLTSDFAITLTGIADGVVLNGFDVVFVPAPGTLALMGLGLLLPALRRRRTR
jgi:hypothetical protein